MKKPKKSRAKDLESAFYNVLEVAGLNEYFKREYVLEVQPPTWIFHKRPEGQKPRWGWDLTHKTRSWEFDFAAPAAHLLIEIDGSTFQRGGHTSGAALENQYNKQDMAAVAGWRVLRITRNMIESGVAMVLVEQALFS